MRARPRVVVVGDLAVDVLVTPSGPVVAGGDVPARIATSGGGAGANTAAWLAHLGVEVTLVARVGDDPAGRAAVAELEADGVRAAVAVDPVAPTATVVVLGGDAGAGGTASRTMLSDRGAAARLAPADLPPLHGVDHLHLSGYVLGDPRSRAAGRAALAAARAAGLTTSLDPQVSGVLGRDLLDGPVDLLLPAVEELAALTGSPALTGDDAGRGPAGATAVSRAAAALLDLAGAVVVTQGAAGATWVDRRGVWSSAAPAVEEVDPTGAGDAFDAGLLAARLAGADPQEALVAGCAAGARAVSRRGARPARRGPRGRCP